jgi:hypothetical protein
MNKHQDQLLKMIFSLVNIEGGIDLDFGDSKYLLSNMIAKYGNCGKIFLSEKTKLALEKVGYVTSGEIKYSSNFYGKSSTFYKRNKIQFVVEHVIPCGILLKMILDSDKTIATIKNLLDINKVVMVLKEEDNKINSLGLGDKITEDFTTDNIWGRYTKSEIVVTENYFINTGSIFR